MPGAFPPPPEADGRPAGQPGVQRQSYPLDLDRVIQLTFSLYRFGWLHFAVIGLVLYLPLAMAVTALQVATSADLLRAQQAQIDFVAGRPVGFFDLAPPSIIILSLLTTVGVGALSFIYQGGLVELTAAIYSGRPASGPSSIKASLRRLFSLLGAGILVVLITIGLALVGVTIGVSLIVANSSGGSLQPGPIAFAGLIFVVATVVGLMVVSIRLAFVTQAVVIEENSAARSISRSWRLVAGSGWRVFGYSLVFGLLTGVVGLIATAAIELAFGSGLTNLNGQLTFDPVRYVVVSVLSALVSVALLPISAIALTLLFYDVRFRRESATEKQQQPGVQGR
jgi:hypothetical protein